LNDLLEIQQLHNRYTDGCSRADWDQVMATFTLDGIWEIQPLGTVHQGHVQLQQAMAGFVKRFDYFMQINSPAVIVVDGDTSTSRCVIRECGKLVGRDQVVDVVGFYNDKLVRTADGWKFSRRSFTSVGVHFLALQHQVPLG
jgi:hypothetical protein